MHQSEYKKSITENILRDPDLFEKQNHDGRFVFALRTDGAEAETDVRSRECQQQPASKM